MKFQLNEAFLILERTPLVLKILLLDLNAGWIHENEGENTWSPYDVIGHLIHGEKTDWLIRAKIILLDKGDKTFEPFDRFAQFENSKGKSLEGLLGEFERLRKENLSQLKGLALTADQMGLKGIHPELGNASLKELLSSWVVHDLGHIAQVSRVMAKQYEDEVGPWRQYLSVLH